MLTGESIPIPLGHEFSGIIEAVGEGVTHVKPGDKCAVIPTIYDGDCRNCTAGMPNCCDRFGFIGLSGWGGGMSEYTSCPKDCVFPLPADFPLDVGALVEPLAVGWHAVATSPYENGDAVLVLGGGPIGLAVVLALLGKGCKNIMVAEVSKRRRQFAKEFGAHHVIDPTSSDVVEEVKRLTNGKGADVAFDAAGVQVAVYSAIKAIRARGTLVNIALWGNKEVSLNMVDMLFGERRYMAGKSLVHPTIYLRKCSDMSESAVTEMLNSDHLHRKGLPSRHRGDLVWEDEARRNDHQSPENERRRPGIQGSDRGQGQSGQDSHPYCSWSVSTPGKDTNARPVEPDSFVHAVHALVSHKFGVPSCLSQQQEFTTPTISPFLLGKQAHNQAAQFSFRVRCSARESSLPRLTVLCVISARN